MKKIVVFLGSPRKNGYSARLAEQVIAGAKSKGADVMVCDYLKQQTEPIEINQTGRIKFV